MPTKLSKLKLSELSLVDRPANPAATVSIFKRDDSASSFSEAYGERLANENAWPMTDALMESLRSIVTDDELNEAARATKVAESLSQFQSTFLAAHSGTNPAGISGSQQASKGDQRMADDKKTIEDVSKALDEATAKLEAATKRADEAELVAKMTDAEKAHMAKLSDADKKAFKAMSDDDRAKLVAKSAADEETVELEGETIAKSEVGPKTFAIMKAQAERISEVEKRAAADRDAAEMVTLQKRASDELAHLPGTEVAKAQVLKAAAGMDEDTRKSFDAMLKAADAAMSEAFVSKGTTRAEQSGDVQKRQNDVVGDIMKRDGTNKSTAMERAASENPELFTQAAA